MGQKGKPMKYLRERKLAKRVLEERLGFAPKMEDIIPLESSGYKRVCDYVMFTIRYHENIIYRASIGGNLEVENKYNHKDIEF